MTISTSTFNQSLPVINYNTVKVKKASTNVLPEQTELNTDGFASRSTKGVITLNHSKIADGFIAYKKLVTCNDVCFNQKGYISDGELQNEICNLLVEIGIKTSLPTAVNEIISVIKMKSYVPSLEVDQSIIPIADGDLRYLGGSEFELLTGDAVKPRPYRLPIKMPFGKYTQDDDPNIFSFCSKVEDEPELFGKWLYDTFYEEDVPTIQRLLGYCLVPTTRVQEMFVIEGDAGVGKGGLRYILDQMLGEAFCPTELNLLAIDKFRTAQIENKLVLYDDELSAMSLKDTAFLKKVVTNEGRISVEKKGVDAYEIESYCKIICNSNQDITTTAQNSNEGFFRRIHPICVRPRDPNRKDIDNLYKTMWEKEKDFIIWWALQGLCQLAMDDWAMFWSDRSKQYLNKMRDDANNMAIFLKEACDFDSEAKIATANLYNSYRFWCTINSFTYQSEWSFTRWLSSSAANYGLTQDFNCPYQIYENGEYKTKRVRGYKGVKLKKND